MPTLRRTTTIAAVAVSGLFAASCGGEDKLSKTDYITQADKICADAQKKLEAVPQPKSANELKDYSAKLKPLLDDAVERLDALEPDDAVKGSADALVSSTKSAVKVAEDLGKTTDEAKVQKLLETAEKTERSTDARLKKDGFKDCASAR